MSKVPMVELKAAAEAAYNGFCRTMKARANELHPPYSALTANTRSAWVNAVICASRSLEVEGFER